MELAGRVPEDRRRAGPPVPREPRRHRRRDDELSQGAGDRESSASEEPEIRRSTLARRRARPRRLRRAARAALGRGAGARTRRARAIREALPRDSARDSRWRGPGRRSATAATSALRSPSAPRAGVRGRAGACCAKLPAARRDALHRDRPRASAPRRLLHRRDGARSPARDPPSRRGVERARASGARSIRPTPSRAATSPIRW